VSLSTDGGEMKVLSTSEDKSIEIEQIESGSEYEIQVVAIKDDSRSDPKSTKVSLEDEEENQQEQEDIKSFENLTAEYKEDSSIIDASWSYNGPTASFEVDVNGQT